jgi:hypothetical protein
MSGYVTKIGYAYAGDTGLKFVEITNPALGYVARAFYVTPDGRGRPGRPSGPERRQGREPAEPLSGHHQPRPPGDPGAPGGDRVNAAGLITRKLVVQA